MSEPVEFGLFDPAQELDVSHRFLPHWFQPGVATFITFRTADSMPREVIEQWRREQEDWLAKMGLDNGIVDDDQRLKQLPAVVQREFRKLRDRAWHGHLDQCHGECVLRRAEMAAIVGKALRYFDGERYDLDSFVVMPNHVHVLVQFRPPTTLRTQCRSWLHYTAIEINKQLDRKGKFWRSEPFDHLVRSVEQFEYFQRYIEENPLKANLPEGDYLFWRNVPPHSVR